ncbi:hypothetical protein CKC_02795 [Candidatus Liberibacter solanacearum CLso-ZC1]|uniref:Uncharacterized protein n=1 Tax=Liberibacter solanacearum (strain CLso-ZC1) TaxID=658172 RepID=E4UD68_LIBSC|nr:hypothetical protein [Candidatus Liberibacter solanacearum]ADR52308.1 hypothetical protein CKC_02795 [Candidatus Liberibacter solanacearum CLso-ZC1]
MVKRNFEQDKSVSYSLLTSRFVIPWEIEDYRKIHAEVETSDGRRNELVLEDDFEVDCEDNFLTLKNTDLKGILRIYDGEKQELKYSIDPNIQSPHNLLRYGDLSPIYLRLENLEKYTDSIETGTKNLSEVVSVLRQKVGQIDIIKMGRDVTVLASKSLEDMAEIAKLQASVKGSKA